MSLLLRLFGPVLKARRVRGRRSPFDSAATHVHLARVVDYFRFRGVRIIQAMRARQLGNRSKRI